MAEEKRIIHVEIDRRTFVDVDGINSGLKRMARLAECSVHLKELFERSIEQLFEKRLEGWENYGHLPVHRLGRVHLADVHSQPMKQNLMYVPSMKFGTRWGYGEATLARIDFGEKTYRTRWKKEDYREDYYQIPETVMRDTEAVLDSLGLERLPLEGS